MTMRPPAHNHETEVVAHPTTATPGRMPAVFVGVGGPRQMWDEPWNAAFRTWAGQLPRPKAILVFSAHWLEYPMAFGAQSTVPLTYDYYNFPPHFYEVQYQAPGAPDLAVHVRELLDGKLEIADSERGLDHGVFIGLKGMYPDADVPVLEVSIPTFDPGVLFAIGRTLAPLRDEGVMIMGAGLVNHSSQNPAANAAFDAWVAETLDKRDFEALLNYQTLGPGVAEALPTVEHFIPLLVVAGAAYDANDAIQPAITGFSATGGSRRSIQFN